MLLGLYGAFRVDPERWLAYSRSNNDYGASHRYVHPDASATAVITAADFLVRAGFADHKLGSYDRSPNAFGGAGGKGYRSRLRARPSLVEALEVTFGITPESIGYSQWSELVRLKAAPEGPRGHKRLVPYGDTIETRRMREQLRDFNAFLTTFRIDLEVMEESTGEIDDEVDREDRPDARDRSATRLYRVFNNRRWDHGGRFYGGWWQALPKRDRARLLIDGEETVELDFKSLHPRLCYHLEGMPLGPEADPYVLPGLEGEAYRPVVKTAFNQLLNAGPGVQPKAPKGALARLPRRYTYKALLQLIETEHQPISGWFRSGRGVELQAIDSEMASAILGYLRGRGICCLPVHDSFIVPRSAEFVLGQTMNLAYHGTLGRFGSARAYPIISGWSSPEQERRVASSLNVPLLPIFPSR
ncbi:hypothetical protein [Altererythrobacter sp. TH136]|uniref:hypothetical protein n=1 Tax=Altererythrobacter sp. TH136 TaxID=2067415 RepID=UPI0011639451|nr:hypothetical protein [Altererythrobacter sp. TH136]QDM41441.1 hypothetical protein C0V74_10615 [Altererythrobacter sp. TH136]